MEAQWLREAVEDEQVVCLLWGYMSLNVAAVYPSDTAKGSSCLVAYSPECNEFRTERFVWFPVFHLQSTRDRYSLEVKIEYSSVPFRVQTVARTNCIKSFAKLHFLMLWKVLSDLGS